MRLTTLMLIVTLMQVSAATFAQKVSLNKTNASLKSVLTDIRTQSGYDFIVTESVLTIAKPISINVKNDDLKDALDKIFSNQPLTYSINQTTITVKEVQLSLLEKIKAIFNTMDVHGKVVDTLNNVLPGATVKVKGTNITATTNANGDFTLKNIDENAVIIVSYIGFITTERSVSKEYIYVRLKKSTSSLDETQIIAYGTTSRRISTGSSSTVKSVDIAKQPVASVLGVLAGKIPGLKATQSDGLPGSSFDLVIRGRNSLTQNYRPLILIDGVPFSNDNAINNFPSGDFANSPLSLLNPGDIESIDVLKDADATSIYGSRGANGVILITTKKGSAGTKVDVNAYTGISNPTYRTKFLNTEQYLQMRHEAFKNDKIVPTTVNAPDLLAWDTTRYTNFTKEFRQNASVSRNLQVDLSGGSQTTQYRFGVGYHYETPSYAKVAELVNKDYNYHRSVISMNTTHRSMDNRFRMSVSASYSFDKDNYSSSTGANLVSIPPNAPYPIDKNGNLVWTEGGASYSNPLGSLNNPFYGKNNSLISSASLSYLLGKGLQIKVNGGFNKSYFKRLNNTEIASQNPASNPVSGSTAYESNISNWQLEPMLQYDRVVGPGNLQLLTGASWSSRNQDALSFNASGYYNEASFGSSIGAASTTYSGYGQNTTYNYTGGYARINYNIQDKYILNLTGRRDGSSRFGPDKRFSNFGAVGAAYVFSQENWVKEKFPVLSFGKLRSSIGVTGNDNIGNFVYINSWLASNAANAYPGATTLKLQPNGLFNPDYSWEKTTKLEAALDLGFFKDRLLVGVNYYRSRSGNQLINFVLPAQVGSSFILKNFPALLQNSGWEFTVSAIPVKSKLTWAISANATIAKNKLLEFPGLDKTSYASRLAIGESISRIAVFDYKGVDPQTGLYTFNGTARTQFVDPNNPTFYGGLTNTFTYNRFSLDILTQFSKLVMKSYRAQILDAPGTRSNQLVEVLNRWQKPGDVAEFQRFTTTGAAATAYSMFTNSTGAYVDASFVRIRNVSLSYLFDPKIAKTLKMQSMRVYFQGQNLALFSKYKDADPENAGIGNPLLRVYTLGLQASF